MDNCCRFRQISLLLILTLIFLICVNSTDAGSKKKKIVIHVPIHKKIEKHIHTVVKHVHHHHKPIVLKEEKKIIHEEHHPVQIHNTKEHVHHHEKHEHEHRHEHHHPVQHVIEEEEHIHHHHNYEHKHEYSGEDSNANSSIERR